MNAHMFTEAINLTSRSNIKHQTRMGEQLFSYSSKEHSEWTIDVSIGDLCFRQLRTITWLFCVGELNTLKY